MKSIGKEQATQEVIEILSDKLTAEEKTGSVAKKLIKQNRCVIIKKKYWS